MANFGESSLKGFITDVDNKNATPATIEEAGTESWLHDSVSSFSY